MMKRKLAPVCTLAMLAVFLSSAMPQQVAGNHFRSDAPREQKIAQAAETLRPQLIAQRRDFHMHPELSNREERTSRIVAERLRALGLEDVKTGVGKYGVTALLKGTKPGSTPTFFHERCHGKQSSEFGEEGVSFSCHG